MRVGAGDIFRSGSRGSGVLTIAVVWRGMLAAANRKIIPTNVSGIVF